MKKLTLIFLSLALAGFTGYAMAEKPADKPGGKPEKVTLLHCGCDWDGLAPSMVYKEITVSSKSKGHFNHVVGSIDSCYAGQVEIDVDLYEDVYVDFVRNGDDCQLAGPPLGDPILDCAGFDLPPVAGDACGVEVID